MLIALLQMGLLLFTGVVWRLLQPGQVDVSGIRSAITALVYYLLLPALILEVMWRAPVGWDTPRIAVVAASGVLLGLGCGWLIARFTRMPAVVAGAALLAAGFPNATYIGLPVLEAAFGPWARSIAIQYDLLACSPLLMSLGVLIAQRYGQQRDPNYSPLRALLKIPPLWAMACALLLNLSAIEPPEVVLGFLHRLGACVVPLMLLSLGISLRWQNGMHGKRTWLVLVVFVQLLLIPAVLWPLAVLIGLEQDVLAATVLEAAMPCMVFGIVLCDRYRLDTSFYAAAVTLSTLTSLLTLPAWRALFAA